MGRCPKRHKRPLWERTLGRPLQRCDSPLGRGKAPSSFSLQADSLHKRLCRQTFSAPSKKGKAPLQGGMAPKPTFAPDLQQSGCFQMHARWCPLNTSFDQDGSTPPFTTQASLAFQKPLYKKRTCPSPLPIPTFSKSSTIPKSKTKA